MHHACADTTATQICSVLKENAMNMFQMLKDGTNMPVGHFKATAYFDQNTMARNSTPFSINLQGTKVKSDRYRLDMDRLELIHLVQDQLAVLMMSQGEVSATVLRDKIGEALFYHLGIREQEEI